MSREGRERPDRWTSNERQGRPERRDVVPHGEEPNDRQGRRAVNRGQRVLDADDADGRLRRSDRLPSVRGTRVLGHAVFHPETLAVEESPSSPIHWRVMFALTAMVICAGTWAYVGRLASYLTANGKVQTAGRTKVLEPRVSGKVVKILVTDGDTVKSNAILVELDPTDALVDRTILDHKLTDLRAENQRLAMEVQAARVDTIDPNTRIQWDKDVPPVVRAREEGVAQAALAKLAAQVKALLSQKHAKEAERDKFAGNIAAQKALVAITQENLTMIESLMKSGYNSQAKYLDMKAQLDDQQVTQTAYEGSLESAKQAILVIDSQIATAREVFVATATNTISTNEQTIVDLAQQLIKAQQTLANMTLRAPVSGIIHVSGVTTVGQIVKPGQQLMQIVPSDAPLEVLAYVSNTDIGFIRKGDLASIKITAFAFKTYGSIDGTVIDIANDALALQGKTTVQTSSLDGEYGPTSDAQKTGNLQFPITVRAARATMMVDGKEVALIPGMAVEVEVLTENRRAIDYLLSPIKDLFSTAGHERT